jgi:hypothetical protein
MSTVGDRQEADPVSSYESMLKRWSVAIDLALEQKEMPPRVLARLIAEYAVDLCA